VELGAGPGAGNLVICEVVKVHLQNKYLDKDGMLDTEKLDLVARMGGAWYSRCTSDSLFTIPKPLQTQGIGVDSLPGHAKLSKVLTGNDLGRLGNADRLPSSQELKVNKEKYLDPINAELKSLDEDSILIRLHAIAKQQLSDGHLLTAISTLINTSDYGNGTT